MTTIVDATAYLNQVLSAMNQQKPEAVLSSFSGYPDNIFSSNSDAVVVASSKVVESPSKSHNKANAGNNNLSTGKNTADNKNNKNKKNKNPKRKRTPKAPDAPRRPLSAYNLFFKRERSLIVSESTAANSAAAAASTLTAASPSSVNSSDAADQNKNTTPVFVGGSYSGMLSTSGRTVVQPVQGAKARQGKRVHRKTHGKIGFAEMARTISSRWKNLDEATRKPYEEQAKVEKERYQEELRKYKERKAKEQAEAEAEAEAAKKMEAKAEVVKSTTIIEQPNKIEQIKKQQEVEEDKAAAEEPVSKKLKVENNKASSSPVPRRPSTLMEMLAPTPLPTTTTTTTSTAAAATNVVTPITEKNILTKPVSSSSSKIDGATDDIFSDTSKDLILSDDSLDSLDNIDESIWDDEVCTEQLINILGASIKVGTNDDDLDGNKMNKEQQDINKNKTKITTTSTATATTRPTLLPDLQAVLPYCYMATPTTNSLFYMNGMYQQQLQQNQQQQQQQQQLCELNQLNTDWYNKMMMMASSNEQKQEFAVPVTAPAK